MKPNISQLYRSKKDEACKIADKLQELKLKLSEKTLTHTAYLNTEIEIQAYEKIYQALLSEADGISQVRELFMDNGNFDYV